MRIIVAYMIIFTSHSPIKKRRARYMEIVRLTLMMFRGKQLVVFFMTHYYPLLCPTVASSSLCSLNASAYGLSAPTGPWCQSWSS